MKTERQSFFQRPVFERQRSGRPAALIDRTTASGLFTQQRPSVMAAVEQLRRPSSQALVLHGSAPQNRWLRELGAGVAATASDLLSALAGPPPSERREAQFDKTWNELQRYYAEWAEQPRSEPTTLQFILRVNPRTEILAALEEEVRAGSYQRMPGRYPVADETAETVHVPVDPNDPFLQKLLGAQETVAHWLLQVVDETDSAVAQALMDKVAALENDALLSPSGDSAVLLIQMREEVNQYICVSPESKAAIVARIDSAVPR